MQKLTPKQKIIVLFLMIVLFFEFIFIISIASPKFKEKLSNNLSAILPSILIAKTNEERLEQDLEELIESPTLNYAAQLKAENMAKNGYFSHTDLEGNPPWHYLKLAGYEYEVAGENLAVNFKESTEVHRAWMKSPTHKANIIQPRFTEIGIGTAEGVYKGKQVTFVVQFFGKPKKDWFNFGLISQNKSVN